MLTPVSPDQHMSACIGDRMLADRGAKQACPIWDFEDHPGPRYTGYWNEARDQRRWPPYKHALLVGVRHLRLRCQGSVVGTRLREGLPHDQDWHLGLFL